MTTRRGYENSEDLKNEIKYLTSLIEQHKNQSTKTNLNSKQSLLSYKRRNNSRQPFHHGNRKWTNNISKTQKSADQVVVKQKYKIVKSSNLTKSQATVSVNEQKPIANQASTSTVQISSTPLRIPSTAVQRTVKLSSRYKKNNIPLKERSLLTHKPKHHVQHKTTSKSRFRYQKNSSEKVLPSPRRLNLQRRSTGTSGRGTPNKKQLHVRRTVHRSQLKFIASSRRKSAALQRLYCLYYISYGKCNRGTYCTLVHDKTRVAICPRLLRGKCTDPKCLLSHVVTKEKLPVCSFYIRGNCNVATCSYLHVNVGKDAIICDDFARRGLCKNAEKCEKRHVRICPEFYEKETCSQRNCRLFHYHKKPVAAQNQTSGLAEDKLHVKTGIVKGAPQKKKKEELIVPEQRKEIATERLLEPLSTVLPHARSMPVLPDFIRISSDSTKVTEASGIRIKPRFNFKPASP